MNSIFEKKEKDIQDFILKFMNSNQKFFLAIDSGMFNYCTDCVVSGIINDMNGFEIYFTDENSDMERNIRLEKSEVKKIVLQENGVNFEFEYATVGLYFLLDEGF